VIILAWFYVTPILYSPAMLPEYLRPYMEINPMFHIVHGYRIALLTSSFPDVNGFFYATAFSVVMLIVGYLFFNKLKNSFAEVL
jgi:ABC-type polysaccharide/polyol phosphate export permease